MTIKRSRTRTISITSNIASNIAIGVTRIDNIITLKFRICGTYDTSSEAKVGRQRARRTFPRQPGNRSPAKTRHNAGSTSNMYRYCDSVLDALVASSASQPQFRSAPNRSSRIKNHQQKMTHNTKAERTKGGSVKRRYHRGEQLAPRRTRRCSRKQRRLTTKVARPKKDGRHITEDWSP